MTPNDPDEDGLIPLSPLDEDEERRRRDALREDLQANRDLLAAMTHQPSVPLEHRENLTTADLEHFVINYCLDTYDGRPDRAFQNVLQLRRFAALGIQTVQEFLDGKEDPALKHIPSDQLPKLLRTLQDDIRDG
ncbi:MAG: hypothetical protein JW849_02510 [Phycisphaerae bacterium]|nr:hypothetical protein [Phycisphaerae bacterium]